ncbi:tetrahydrofolate dehydrogenase/cyclohydrolase catalytic domain-containing protein, partial [Amphritea sp. 1_MG-2023]|uniref:bifunctional 5,10-methylenetetrahydrofolate dehydrogenase/5,10-methenyltetrahydrofolate cyclohydrolase n=1 Tax=Amphritea sp. 1_MG-2023 TaxID=3062670 RepID=UPI0026E27DED
MAQLIDGKQLSDAVVASLAEETSQFAAEFGLLPGLAVVLVGEDPASQVYVRNKVRQATAAGMRSIEHRLPKETTQQELNSLIETLNQDPEIHGVLVQLPLPAHLSEPEIIRLIAVEKDVDGFHPLNVGALASGTGELIPCTPLGCMLMLQQVHDDLSGLHAVVVGRSNIVGKPMAQLLLQANCTVTVVHSRTRDIEAVCREA